MIADSTLGRHAEAEPLFLKAMEIRRSALDEQHPDHASSLNNLVELCRALGRHVEAEPLYLKALEITRSALGEGLPSYATVLRNLATLYRELGRHAEADALDRPGSEP